MGGTSSSSPGSRQMATRATRIAAVRTRAAVAAYFRLFLGPPPWLGGHPFWGWPGTARSSDDVPFIPSSLCRHTSPLLGPARAPRSLAPTGPGRNAAQEPGQACLSGAASCRHSQAAGEPSGQPSDLTIVTLFTLNLGQPHRRHQWVPRPISAEPRVPIPLNRVGHHCRSVRPDPTQYEVFIGWCTSCPRRGPGFP